MHGVPPMMQHGAILNFVLDLCNGLYVVVFIPYRVPSSQPKSINMVAALGFS